MNSIELFGSRRSGLGVSACRLQHEAVVELDRNSCDTIRENTRLDVKPVNSWPLFQADVHELHLRSSPALISSRVGRPVNPSQSVVRREATSTDAIFSRGGSRRPRDPSLGHFG